MAATRAGDNTLRERMRAFPDEAACVRHLEQQRWPAGIVCPLCSASGKMYRRTRVGVYKCAACRQEFSVRKGTIYEKSPLPLQKWYMAACLMATSRQGISSYQLARAIGVTQKTARFVLGRLRQSSEQASHKAGTLPGPGEADESDFGGKNKNRPASKKQRNGRPMQQAIVEASRAGQHVLGILPTGTGTSPCYQIPALSRYDKTGALLQVLL